MLLVSFLKLEISAEKKEFKTFATFLFSKREREKKKTKSINLKTIHIGVTMNYVFGK